MPRVPRFERTERTRAITTSQFRDIDADFQAGARLTGQVIQASKQAADYFQREERKADNMAVMSAKEELDGFQSEYLHNADTGALNKRGEDSFGLPEDYSTQFAAKRQEISKRLNERQQEQFNLYAQTASRRGNETLQKHISRETNAFNEGRLKARVAGLQQRVLDNAYDPKAIADNLKEQNVAIFQLADANGLSDEETTQLINEANSKTHRGILNSYLTRGEDLLAKEYYNKIAKDMNASDRLLVEKAIEQTSTLSEGQRQTDRIMDSGLTLEESLEKARDLKDPKLRDMVVKRVKTRFSEAKEIKRLQEEDLYLDIYNDIVDGDGIETVNKEKLALLPPSKQKSLMDAAYAPRKTSNLSKFQDYEVMAADPEQRDKFLMIDASVFAKDLKAADVQKMIKKQTDIRNGNVDEFEATGITTKSQMVTSALDSIGLSKEAKRKAKPQFQQYVDNEVIRWSELNKRPGKDIPRQELQKIIDKGMIEGEVDGSGFFLDTEKRFFQLSPEEIPDFAANETEKEKLIKEAKHFAVIRARVEQRLIALGVSYTEQDLNDATSESIRRNAK